MKYWKALENRSITLWQALFAPRRGAEGRPVDIESAPSPAGAAQETPEERGGQASASAGGIAENAAGRKRPAAEAAAQADSEAAARRAEAARQTEKTARKETAAFAAPLPAAEGRQAAAPAPVHAESGAADLWAQLRRAGHSAAFAASAAAQPAPPRQGPALPEDPAARMAGAADWSTYFEQDARRYDGGHPLY